MVSNELRGVCGIYAITNTVTGEQYIGASQDIETRFRQHKSELRLGRHHSPRLQEAWNTDGEDAFTLQVLAQADGVLTLRELERRYLAERRAQLGSDGLNGDHSPVYPSILPERNQNLTKVHLSLTREAWAQLNEMSMRRFHRQKYAAQMLEELIREAYAREIERQGEAKR